VTAPSTCPREETNLDPEGRASGAGKTDIDTLLQTLAHGPRPEWGQPLYAIGLGRSGWPELSLWSVGWYLAGAER
jgi:hypothetical protein